MKTIIEQISSLEETKQKLSVELSNVIHSLSICESADSIIVPSSPKPSPSSKKRVYVISAGLIVLGVGLLSKHTIVSVFGSLVTVLGILMKPTKIAAAVSDNKPTNVDYSQECGRVFNILKGAHEKISDKWDNCLKTQVEEIKNYINSTVSDQDKLTAVYDCLSQRSIVSFPISKLFQDLLAAYETQNPSTIKSLIDQFSCDYNKALDVACEEQKQRYERISDLI